MYEQEMKVEKETSHLGQPTMEILIAEHKILFKSLSNLQMANRAMLGILVLFQISPITQLVWQQMLVMVVGTMITILWFVRESWINQQLKQLGDLIAQTDDDETWRYALIRWRHETWQHSRYSNLIRLEPILWLGLIFSIVVISSRFV